ncbi:MAG: hypothetical protein VX492_01120 [Candidatus Thermoplasmatota archaeon]|nr:hypothetical protein [Candidatus Thermoplasmatota archaeon]
MITGVAEIDILILIVAGGLWILDQIFNDGKLFASEDDSSEEKDAEPATGPFQDSPSARQRQQMDKCAMDHCNSLSFRNTDYCWKHQDAKRHVTDGPGWWEEGGESL